MIRGQDDECQFTAGEVLLIAHILIAGEEHIEFRILSHVEQSAILKPLPSQFIRPHYLLSSQETRKRCRGIGVKQDLHATAADDSRELLAKASTSCTCSRLTDGNHSKNSSTVEPRSR